MKYIILYIQLKKYFIKKGDDIVAYFDQIKREETPKGLINPISPIRSDICPLCKAQKVELFSFNDYAQGYRQAVEANLKGYDVNYNKYEIRYMRCTGCKHLFTIDWSHGFPVPLQDTAKTSQFFREFLAGY